MTSEPDDLEPGEPGLTLVEVISSVVAAAFGVQSARNRARDFARGSARQFVVVGLLATGLFVLLVYGVVQLILWLAAV